ncbi:poly [ADP-ribose] polymerase tankyrase-2-like [Gigantopelta aegis]|uniref:poly [ADP-ribose] polymerase tankyrase-2-like n=1 Tax=Gigantopelta aegis TaxID=1735272 RepID=UPI001B88B3F4|nr:poly [ADP-ribose] polymerase tankyrase-2-like [Gigantopelta aegis]XP_041360065.1 poly [ADP-ribose] polymerase tankyrase-2-like [Gigantopelta aegis]
MEDEDDDDAHAFILNAVTSDDLVTVRDYLQNGKVTPSFVSGGKNLVCEAAYSGHVQMLSLLLQYKFDATQCDISDQWHRQPIHIAASRGHLEVLKCLLENGVNINSQDSHHRTPLHCVSVYGHTEIARYLLLSGASVNMTQLDGFTPLHAATCLGHYKTCQLLIEHKAEVDKADDGGWTALHTAVCYGQERVVEVLLDAGASLVKKTNEEGTAFNIAARSGYLNIVKLLHSRGANVNDRDMQGYTPLHLSVCYKRYSVTRYLLLLNVQIDTCNYAGETPFYLACVQGDEKIILLLIHAGFNVGQLEWLRRPTVLPMGIANLPSLVALLRQLAANPRTLTELACFRVRSLLLDRLVTDVDKLPLPLRLQDLLAYRTLAE